MTSIYAHYHVAHGLNTSDGLGLWVYRGEALVMISEGLGHTLGFGLTVGIGL